MALKPSVIQTFRTALVAVHILLSKGFCERHPLLPRDRRSNTASHVDVKGDLTPLYETPQTFDPAFGVPVWIDFRCHATASLILNCIYI